MTPWGTPQGRTPYTSSSTGVWFVSNGCTDTYGIRPALLFASDLLVSVEGDDEAEPTVYGQLLTLIDGCSEADLRLAVHAIGEKMLRMGGKDKGDEDEY